MSSKMQLPLMMVDDRGNFPQSDQDNSVQEGVDRGRPHVATSVEIPQATFK